MTPLEGYFLIPAFPSLRDPKDRNLASGGGSHLHLISDSTDQDFYIFPQSAQQESLPAACVSKIGKWGGVWGPGVGESLASISKSDIPRATKMGKEKTQHFAWYFVPTKLLSSTFVVYGWHQVRRPKGNTWEIL